MEINDSIKMTFDSAIRFEQIAYQQQMQFNTAQPPVQHYIVNLTFSLELYLKCLIMIETKAKPIREHNLKKLFRELNEENLTLIQSDYKSQIKDSLTIKAIKTNGTKVNTNFWHVIDEMQLAYNEWRYFTIDGLPKKNLIGLGNLVDSVKNRILQLHPMN